MMLLKMYSGAMIWKQREMVTNLIFKIEYLLFLEEYNIKNNNVLSHQYKILSQL